MRGTIRPTRSLVYWVESNPPFKVSRKPALNDRKESPRDAQSAQWRWVAAAAWMAIFLLCLLRFSYLKADFPNFSPWMDDQAKFTDEGWWASGAVMHHLLGHWNVPGDYNPGAALPVWPLLLSIVFHFTGISLTAARALNVGISVSTLGVVFLLVRRFTGSAPALLSALLLASSPFAFAFSRLAILDSLIAFEFCLLLLVASCASAKRFWPLPALTALVITMILTKTTSAVLLPAVFWLAWQARGRNIAGFLRLLLAVAVLPAALLAAYELLVSKLGYGVDYHYFFSVNRMPVIAWDQTLATIWQLLCNCFWVDRILYPIGLVAGLLSLVWMRRLWRNPLFAAAWIALLAQAGFLFSRQDDFGPRYFLVLLVPLVLVVVLTWDALATQHKKASAALLLALGSAAVLNTATICQFLAHRQYQYCDAAASIRKIVLSDPRQKPLILGVSGAQISLMAGIPSINDFMGSENIAQKIMREQPGWYLVWNSIDSDNAEMLSAFQLEEVARYPVFDNQDRDQLILYKMALR